MKSSRVSHVLRRFERDQTRLIDRLTRHAKERPRQEHRPPVPCTREKPCWDCPRCVPARYA
jgi:hypothetical protein